MRNQHFIFSKKKKMIELLERPSANQKSTLHSNCTFILFGCYFGHSFQIAGDQKLQYINSNSNDNDYDDYDKQKPMMRLTCRQNGWKLR